MGCTEEEEAHAMFPSGAHELRGLVDERDKVAVLDGVAPGVWGRREARGPRRARPKELLALAGGGGPDVAEGLGEEAPRGCHGGGRLRRGRRSRLFSDLVMRGAVMM